MKVDWRNNVNIIFVQMNKPITVAGQIPTKPESITKIQSDFKTKNSLQTIKHMFYLLPYKSIFSHFLMLSLCWYRWFGKLLYFLLKHEKEIIDGKVFFDPLNLIKSWCRVTSDAGSTYIKVMVHFRFMKI